jgi:polyisoprenoid-binding protein YceI
MRKVLMICALAALAYDGAAHPAADANTSAPLPPYAGKIPAGSYTLDKSHSTLIFRVNHLGFSKYTARFTVYDATLQFDPANLAAAAVDVTIDPASITIDNPPPGFADALRGAQWLDTQQFGQITFHSTKVDLVPDGPMRVHGELTLHGVRRPVVLAVTFNGGWAGHPLEPHARVGFSAQGSFKRSDFGITSGIPRPGNNVGVSDQVDLIIEAEFFGAVWAGAGANAAATGS